MVWWQVACPNSCPETLAGRGFITCSSTIQNLRSPWSYHQKWTLALSCFDVLARNSHKTLPPCKGSGTWSPVSVQGGQESQCWWALVRCAMSTHGARALHMFYLISTEGLRSNNISFFADEKTEVV